MFFSVFNHQVLVALLVNRFLDDLNAQGLIRKLTTVVRHGTASQTVTGVILLYSSLCYTTVDPVFLSQTIKSVLCKTVYLRWIEAQF